MISFEWLWIFALLPLPLLAYWLLPAYKKNQTSLFMPRIESYGLAESYVLDSHKSHKARLFLLSLIWTLLLLAAAKPIHIGDAVELPNTGRDMFLAVDLSGSMQIEDMQLNGRMVDRLVMVKHVLSDFIEQRKGDRLGLILFASNAYVQAPLTSDLKTVEQLLQEALIGFAGQQTAIGDAIGLAIKRLADRPEDRRVVILLTDGANNAGSLDPLKAAELAKQEHVVVHTIAFGSDQPVRGGLFGMNRASSSDDYDEKTLSTIADMTGGRYFRARNQQDLERIYQVIDQLEEHETEHNVFRPQKDLFHWPLSIAMLLFFFLLAEQRFALLGAKK